MSLCPVTLLVFSWRLCTSALLLSDAHLCGDIDELGALLASPICSRASRHASVPCTFHKEVSRETVVTSHCASGQSCAVAITPSAGWALVLVPVGEVLPVILPFVLREVISRVF